MKNSLYIAKVAGIKIFIHWTFFLLIFWIIASNIRAGNNTQQIMYSLVFIMTIFFCIVLHELGHALTAKRFNYKTKDIILLPIGGMARMEELPENPKQELLIAIAGPLVNVVIAVILYPFINWEAVKESMTTAFVLGKNNFLFSLLSVNISLVLFNLIPAFPMDGGRMLRAILSMQMDRVKATAIAARTGQIFSVIFFILGIFYNPFLILIALLIFITAQAEHEDVASKFILHRYKVKDVISHNYSKIEQSAPIMDAAKLLLDTQSTDFLVADNNKIVGTLNRDEIIKALTDKGEEAKVAEAMNDKVKFTNEEESLDVIFREFRSGKTTIMPVIKGNDLTGTVDLNNIIELILIQTALKKHTSGV
jgi:Zn-dependent protease/CBS domain-containing protein